MARPIYQHETTDPDFAWLINTFKENHPEYFSLETSGLPVIFFKLSEDEFRQSMLPMCPAETEETDLKDSSE